MHSEREKCNVSEWNWDKNREKERETGDEKDVFQFTLCVSNDQYNVISYDRLNPEKHLTLIQYNIQHWLWNLTFSCSGAQKTQSFAFFQIKL